MSKIDEDKFELSMPDLESPSPIERTLGAPGAPLLMDEGLLAANAAKLFATESFLGLVVKNLSFQDFMREVMTIFLRATQCEAGAVFEADLVNRELFFRAAAGQSSDLLEDVRIPMGKGIVGYVYESRQLACVQSCKSDPRFLAAVGNAVKFESRNLVAAPVVIRDQVFCVIEVINHREAADFSEGDLDLIRYLCDAAGRVIEARLMMNWAAAHSEARAA